MLYCGIISKLACIYGVKKDILMKREIDMILDHLI